MVSAGLLALLKLFFAAFSPDDKPSDDAYIYIYVYSYIYIDIDIDIDMYTYIVCVTILRFRVGVSTIRALDHKGKYWSPNG